MHPRFFIMLLVGLGVALAALILKPSFEGLNHLLSSDLASSVAKGAILGLLLLTISAFFRERFSQAVRGLLLWLAILLVLAAGYSFRGKLGQLGDHLVADLIPGHPVQIGRTVEIARTRGREFQILTEVNGAPVTMVLDTGASAVVLTRDAAKAAGLPIEVLRFTVEVDTANGRGRAASVTLDHVAVGGVIEHSVPALIAQSGQLKQSLLGMSFLNRLGGWEVRGDRLMIRAAR